MAVWYAARKRKEYLKAECEAAKPSWELSGTTLFLDSDTGKRMRWNEATSEWVEAPPLVAEEGTFPMKISWSRKEGVQ